ncbi:hypothetical protein PQO03_13760 [Lentisphaera profundi]|uniref:Glycosyl hydrolase family 43 n=1 Tax=Lentisphaera profundi TaxID=1658616 RepID=A0ABY7VXB7_9BACT|nr:hypothetical protein [Lentisphaera profundi]WDE98901.1 hypothetical protein PQO03_13760 [Lentisphaera profundi]
MISKNRFFKRAHLVLVFALPLFGQEKISDDKGYIAKHAQSNKNWRITSSEDWKGATQEIKGLTVDDDLLSLVDQEGVYHSKLQRFKEKRSAQTMKISASTKWENWEPTKAKITPPTLGDAPIFLVKGPNDYWIMGRNRAAKAKGFKSKSASLEGFDIPLKTTPHPHLFDAPGAAQKNQGGYNAWQSHDMINWVHHGSVTAKHAKWSTTAEFVDGKAYIYYDFPNDQDPHLYIDDDLTDGKPGKDMGLAFKDPSDGSDCSIIRDLEGKFHLIYENFSPINARKHSWDSPLAGHAVSEDGKGDFKILAPAVDDRTEPTGKFAEYPHPHWHEEDPKNFPGKTMQEANREYRLKKGDTRAFAKYEIHTPAQNAYGDWASIAIGGQYYLVGDYHPAHKKIRIGIFTSPSLDQQFELIGELGEGHPDPDIGFAEGKFYLINQTNEDYVSPGPWVEKVEARVGVDTTNDGKVDSWSDWQEVKEQYDYIKGFSKQVKRIPASMDLSRLPEGYGFCFELKLQDTTKNKSKPMLDKIEIQFE